MSYKLRNEIEYCFIAIQIAFYAAFLVLDITGKSITISSYIKFGMIILCFCYALFLGKGADKSILFCMKTALLFTVVSDLFLLILDYYFFGVITFIIVQQLYGLRLILSKINRNHKSKVVKEYGLRLMQQLVLSCLIYFILYQTDVVFDKLLLVSVFYFVSIASNTVSAIVIAGKHLKYLPDLLFAIGMVLFLLCDINVGIFNLSGFITLPEKLYHTIHSISSILMWTFYAPSQVLISISATKYKTDALLLKE